ncbi:MAG: isoprenylcysteine carboxylmethyltransferase family protein [Dehalococcoidia bacterium]|nr:MAG: isoprenylcysteine carboxylmethyltransferase family protein [Dehalococcoidia bacterium]
MFSNISIGLDYAWWFPAIYLLITIAIMVIYGKGFTKKFLRLPGSKFKWKIPTILSSTLFSRGIMAYAIFIPIHFNTVWFWVGVVFFGGSTILSTLSMINFATTPLDKPVTKGIYRISRHPIQVFAIIMLIGVGLVTASWIIIVLSLLLAVISYPTFLIQERSCLETYGNAYQKYMDTTPMWIGYSYLPISNSR